MLTSVKNRLKRIWSSLSLLKKAFVVFFAIMFVVVLADPEFRASLNDPPAAKPATKPATKPAYEPAPKETKNLGQKVYGSSLIDYTEADGRILVAFEGFRGTTESIEGDVAEFMRQLTKDTSKEWQEVTLSAYLTFMDRSTGAREKKPAYTITFTHDEAAKVVDWDRVDVQLVGTLEYAHAGLQ